MRIRNNQLNKLSKALQSTFSLICLVAFVATWQLSPARAQTDLPPELLGTPVIEPSTAADAGTPTPSLSPEEQDAISAIAEKQRLESEIVIVLQTYRGQLETYRNLEKEYDIAYDVFLSTPTLVAIDNAVSATRAVIVSRTDVLKTYLELLRLRLTATEGIEITIKEKTLNKLELYIEELEKYGSVAQGAQNRDGVNLAVSYFTDLGKGVEIAASEAQGLIVLGRLQSSYDQSQVIQRELQFRFPEDKRTPAQSRSMEQIAVALADADALLKVALTDLQTQALKGTFDDFYRDRVRVLNPAYAKLSRVNAYQTELLTL